MHLCRGFYDRFTVTCRSRWPCPFSVFSIWFLYWIARCIYERTKWKIARGCMMSLVWTKWEIAGGMYDESSTNKMKAGWLLQWWNTCGNRVAVEYKSDCKWDEHAGRLQLINVRAGNLRVCDAKKIKSNVWCAWAVIHGWEGWCWHQHDLRVWCEENVCVRMVIVHGRECELESGNGSPWTKWTDIHQENPTGYIVRYRQMTKYR